MAKMDYERPKYKFIDFEYDDGNTNSSRRYKGLLAEAENKKTEAKNKKAEARNKRKVYEINARVIFLSRILMNETNSDLLKLPNPIENARKIYRMSLPMKNEAEFNAALLKNKDNNLASFIQQYMDMNHDGVHSLYYLMIAIDRLMNVD